jgi:hypothetical protein
MDVDEFDERTKNQKPKTKNAKNPFFRGSESPKSFFFLLGTVNR